MGNYRKSRKAKPRAMPGFPDQKVVKMRYVEAVTVDPAIATLGLWQFRANSIFDPDQTGAGHQPLGHDEWSQFYNHAVVLGSKINAKFSYTAGNSNNNQMIGVYLSDDAVIPDSGLKIAEQGLGTYKLMGAVNYAPGGLNTVPTLYNTFSAKNFFNVSDVKDNMVRLGSTFGANPAENAVYTTWVYNTTGTDLGPTEILVTIDYIVLLSEPKSLEQS